MAEDPKGRGEGADTGRVRSETRPGGLRPLRSPGEALQPELAPAPPITQRRRRPIIGTLSGIFSFIGIAAVALIILVSLGAQRIGAPGPLPADKVVVVAPGSDVSDIVGQLEREGVIDSWPLMTGTLYLEGSRSKIKAGEYLFKQNASLREVIDTLVSGKQILHEITIPEGLTSEQIVQRLKDNDILVGDVKVVPKEGTLMPETYKFARGTPRDQILHTMQEKQKRVVNEVWAHRASDVPMNSPFEMITLASIVEKETGKADERSRVAGVFVNRLSRNMPLQSDPTIVYGLVGGKGTLGRGILRSEIEQKTPYNTYAIAGLPPGPICNPGRAAMEAAVNPSRTKDIYFVADGTGGHAFAETLDQHRLNVAHWRQIEKDAKDKTSPDADKLIESTPPPVTVPKPNQRGDRATGVPVYGALLRGRFEARVAPPSLMTSPASYPPSIAAQEQVEPIVTRGLSAYADPQVGAPNPEGDAGFGPAPSGEDSALAASAATASTQSFPVSPARRADEKAQAAQFGLAAGSERLPRQGEMTSVEPAASDSRSRLPIGRGRVVDASEGTALDPLRDKTYDLNTAKTVPLIKAVGPDPALAK